MMKRPIEAVLRTRSMHRKGLGVCEISKMLRIPHQTVSDWISGRRRPGEHEELFKRSERPMPPEFSGRCPDCGRQMQKNVVGINPFSGRGPEQVVRWGCRCGLSVKTQGNKIVSAWLAED